MAALKVFVNGVLAFSPLPGAPNLPVTFKALKNPVDPSYFCFALLEMQAIQGDFFVTVSADRAGGGLSLYGPVEGVHVTADGRSPFGLRVVLAATTEHQVPVQARSLVFDFSDASGASLGSFTFRFACRGVAEEALFRLKKDKLPELEAEAGRATSQFFEVETLQSGSNSVGYAIAALSPPGAAFGHGLQQAANRYQAPDGPLVDAEFFGRPPNAAPEVFVVTGTDSQSATQDIPFISWLVDTPARGELRIVGIDPDPAGSDRNAESITLENVSSRVLNVGQCYLEDEQHISLFGATLNLPYGTPGRQVIASGRLGPGARMVVKPSFTMNNDFDAFTLRNRRGRKLDYMAYLRRLPGSPPPAVPRQTVVFRQTVSLTGRDETADVMLSSALEDGDLVLIRPDPASKLWSGEIPHPWTGPAGWLDANGQPVPAPAGWVLPLPSAPLYALLMFATPEPKLIGNAAHSIVIDRQSKAVQGLGAGTRQISFLRNDPSFNRFLTWGQFDIEVIVLRH